MSVHKLNVSLGLIIKNINELITAQHSDEWYKARRFRIGGSEIATYLGIKTYKTIQESLNDKILTKAKPKFLSVACSWGSLLECVIREHCEFIYKTVIHETGAIPSSVDQAMSPDGIGIVVVDNNGIKEHKIALFEYKCPLSRKIEQGKIPIYYIPQVLIGLETISICDFAIFIESTLKKCKLESLGSSSDIDATYNNFKKTNHYGVLVPHCWGAIAFSKTNKEYGPGLNKYKAILEYFDKKGLIDFGKESGVMMDNLLEAYTEGFISAHYLYQQNAIKKTKDEDEYTKEDILELAAQHENVIGVMRWKLIEKNTVIIEKKKFLEKTEYYAAKVNAFVRSCEKMNDEQHIKLEIDKFAKALKKEIDNDEMLKQIIADI